MKNDNMQKKKLSSKKDPEKNIKPAVSDWIFMSIDEITTSDLYIFLKPLKLGELDFWEEMNILSLEMPDRTCIDMEGLKEGFSDGKDRQFMIENGYKTVFFVSLSCYNDSAKAVFEKILEHFPGGFFADTEDFKPNLISKK
ncbi:hypothetical protein [Anaerocolumna xylanovorans]|uniref:Uncharacterized protein n=1 Tax=Anaerocolumna xylanovorans DSM 12503 TaxID=1121345 RepID=A0A1M7Y0W6_9FIRM|nr:hypothetical protein [Anaerocolumna xylanovorans]SHO45147.1 hypothetical protein SAMN02745217_00843 [Anaerocolumna xylanovorans DSM 12503]